MIYNFNTKETTESNKINKDKISELEKEDDGEREEKIIEEINYTKKNIEENNIQKNQIYESIKKNEEQKEELKKILLNLLNNKTDSINQYIHILKEKDKLFKITKQYEKEIENYVKIQKQKDEDINKINRKIEILRAKLKEKDKKINELEKKGGKQKLDNKNVKYISNNKSKINENSKIEDEKNKSPIVSYKIYTKSLKINDSKRNKLDIKEMLSPNSGTKGVRKTLNQKKSSYTHIIKEKNNFNTTNNNTKRLSTIPSKAISNSIVKKCKKVNKINYKTENNDENINNSNLNNIFELKKYKDLTIPKTTITLTDIENSIKINKPNYLKPKINITSNNNENKIKKSLNNNNNDKNKKYSSIMRQNSKKITNNITEFAVKSNKNLIKSVTVDLKREKYSPEKISNVKSCISNKTDKSDKSNKSKKNNNNNLLIVKPFKAEKLSIDLNNLKSPLINQNDLNEKINNIKLSKKNNKAKNSNSKTRKMKNIKLSKSNPKLLKEIQINKMFIKKLSLQEARYENKMKGEKKINQRNELNTAESFINEYKKMKTNETFQQGIYFKNKINHSTTTLLNKDKIIEGNDNSSCITDIHKIRINKIYIGIDELKSENNIKEINKNSSVKYSNNLITNYNKD